MKVWTFQSWNAVNRSCRWQARGRARIALAPPSYSVNHSLQIIAPKLAPRLAARLANQRQLAAIARLDGSKGAVGSDRLARLGSRPFNNW